MGGKKKREWKNKERRTKDLNECIRKSILKFRPPEKISVSEWADKYRVISAGNAEPGRWKTSRTPYLKEIMDAFSDPKVHRIVIMASSQVGKTELILNIIAYIIDQDPGSILYIVPTVDFAKDFSRRRVEPMIRDTKRIRDKVEMKSRDGSNTVLRKSYPGGMITIVGSNAPASLAGIPAKYIFGDERDRFAESAGDEGDPWKLAEARAITFYNHKMVEVSTPTIKGKSEIEKSFHSGTMERWCVECPHCQEWFFVEMENIMYTFHTKKKDHVTHYTVDSVECVCPKCGCASSEEIIKKQPHKWMAENPDAYQNGVRSFYINGFISPWMRWNEIILKYLESKGEPNALQTVYNTLLGKSWDGDTYVNDDSDEMLKKREEYEAELPEGVLCLTCGVDTQDNRLEYEVVGYGFEGENWGIERGVIPGRPSDRDVWERLDGVVDRVYRFKDGKGLKISITFVDSGGHYTQDVYEQCAKRLNKRVFAIKGKDGEGRPYTDVPKKTKIIKEDRVIGEAWFYLVGVDSGKAKIMAALDEDAGRKCHFPSNPEKKYNEYFFNGLLSENMVLRGKKWVWEKIPGHNRNEALDCRNYANAAFDALKPNLYALHRRLQGMRAEKKRPEAARKKKQKKRMEWDDDDW